MFICPCPYYAQHYITINYIINIDTAAKVLTLLKDGKWFKSYPVAVGKPSTHSPKGTFKIINKALNPGGPFGARWMGLSAPGGSYGIHGTNNPDSIGKEASSGCIRMYNNHVIELYNLVSIGTTVKIR
jgi:lipoprotein-anchoring transpeptidase ErfK/SrfK